MFYSLDGEDWGGFIPRVTNQGSYTVYFKVKGNDNYNDVGQRSITAEIKASSLQPGTDFDPETDVTLSETEFVYNGGEQKPTVTFKLKDGTVLIDGADYDVTYYKVSGIDSDGNPVASATPVTPEEAGEKVAVVTLEGNYSGTIKVRADVKKRPVAFAPRGRACGKDACGAWMATQAAALPASFEPQR